MLKDTSLKSESRSNNVHQEYLYQNVVCEMPAICAGPGVYRRSHNKCRLILFNYSLSQSPCTALTAGINLPVVRAVQGNCHWGPKKRWEFPLVTWEHNALGNPNLYLDQPITKAWCQPVGGRVSYPTDSPIATRLGLYSSLIRVGFIWIVGVMFDYITYYIYKKIISLFKTCCQCV